MIELRQHQLVFSFPDVHPDARLRIVFERTLRIPDDDREYPLPPGLGAFPLRHIDDFAQTVPRRWIDRGGVMLPMYQAEAMWLAFHSEEIPRRGTSYPFAVKIATGKRSAITGDDWRDDLSPRPQDYLVVPTQPWLDGYCVDKGQIRQFVAMPLGAGYTAEEQLTGEAEHGGLQIAVHPMRRDAFEARFPERDEPAIRQRMGEFGSVIGASEMGLAPGGRMKQEIYEDPYRFEEWDRRQRSRCFVHIVNSLVWRSITGAAPPTTPFTAAEYTKRGLPWFEYYDADAKALAGSGKLDEMKSVATLGTEKGGVPRPENEPVDPGRVVHLRAGLTKEQVREGNFSFH